ncbi:two-component system, OmpR family, sensor histidine kinase ChvG [Roseovarius litoreus]|uniref:histidine kinase n=1 Tax=Roseovarius litoreus TaxID=1155722 RepID=A0A1M7J1W9_9RHOB|nr:sensor histidine kinase [Roseovarius litoreus]SHM46913.1 two-component system, OmpR family, sensor histidine kinase ChvG [Roseovarius litoreus]
MALAEGIDMRDRGAPRRDDDVVLGDDFVAPDSVGDEEVRTRRERRGFISLRESSLTRKIITFNLVALSLLLAGVLFLNSSRDSLALQRAGSMVSEVELVADVFEAQLPSTAPVNLMTGDGIDVIGTIEGLDIQRGVEVFVFDSTGALAGRGEGDRAPALSGGSQQRTFITDLLSRVWGLVSAPFDAVLTDTPETTLLETVSALVGPTLQGAPQSLSSDVGGRTVFAAATPIIRNGEAVGAVAMVNASGEIDQLVRAEHEWVLRMFLIATAVSVGLSLILASTIANPLSDLAAAAEIGGDRNRGKGGGRIRIPDLTARPDEIGRLSGALRGMVAALYHRIDSNEQFAADVAHEIKNPLASLRSAVGTMRVAKRPDQREKLLEVIEHDVRRLDRLVSDISNASRLDSELVKEEQEPFDLLAMLRNLGDYLGEEAEKKGVEFITDFPNEPIVFVGLEGRLAQVFVNLITNAISFCEDGDAIRLWVRKRDNRVLVVVEDTGPGIPDQALTKIFKRFYSQRAENDFGNNSGLGLSISKQIVEAHDGVIWAENIRPTDADPTSDPLGARFVVGLPV